LLRDINDPSTSELALLIKQKINGLKGLQERLIDIHNYLEKVLNGKIPINNQIAYNLQNIMNLLPNLNVEELIKSMLVKTNDIHLVTYLSALVRSILALHDLFTNKIKYKDMDEILDRDAGIDSGNNKELSSTVVEKKNAISDEGKEKKIEASGDSKNK
jgi:26S proteasome regulatory subunit N8